MNNSIGLTYHGKVNIKVGKKTYSNFNQGTNFLFKQFVQFLCEYDIAKVNLPSYIDVVDITNALNKNSILNQQVNILKEYKEILVDEEPIPALVITTAISDVNISMQPDAEHKYELHLYDRDPEQHLLASIAIKSDILTQITTGRQALIEWYLYITNKQEGEIN